jgi:hypothetical protein
VTFFLCGPIASGDCSTGGSNIGKVTLTGGTPNDGSATAQSANVNTAAGLGILAAGRYCFRAEWPGDATYPTALSHTNSTTECFAVKDTSSLTTAQVWVPNDTATVVTGSGGAAVGTVTFTLYSSSDCSGTAVTTFANRPVDQTTGVASTNNTSTYVASATISWRAQFIPTDSNAIAGSSSRCEASGLTINNNVGP